MSDLPLPIHHMGYSEHSVDTCQAGSRVELVEMDRAWTLNLPPSGVSTPATTSKQGQSPVSQTLGNGLGQIWVEMRQIAMLETYHFKCSFFRSRVAAPLMGCRAGTKPEL